MTTTEKTCFKCGAVKPIGAFYKHKMMSDGHLNKCKECTRKDARRNRSANAEYYRAYDRGRGFRVYDPKKVKARAAVRCLTAPDHCEMCCKVCRPHAHHEDYTKPLDVWWLCRDCHGFVHRSEVA